MIIIFFIVLVVCSYFLYLNKKGKLEIFNQYVKSWEDGRIQARKLIKRIGIEHLDDLIQNHQYMAISILNNDELGDFKYRQDLADGILGECVGMKYYRSQRLSGKRDFPQIYSKEKIKEKVEKEINKEWESLKELNEVYLNYKITNEYPEEHTKEINKIIELEKNMNKNKKKYEKS